MAGEQRGLPSLIVNELLTIHRKTDCDLAIQEVRLGEAKHNIFLQSADVCLDREGLAQTEEVVGAVTQADERASQSTHAAGKTDLVFASFSYFQREVDQAVFFVEMALGHVGILWFQLLEESQLVQPLQAQLPILFVIDLAFFEHQFAAYDFVARSGISLELNSAD